MTKEKLIALLHNPNQIIQEVNELNSLVETYPYFHTGHQLYIKGLQQTNKPKMERQLGVAAISVRDRVMLYDYLNDPDTFLKRTLPVDAPVEVVAAAVEPVVEKKAETVAEPVIEKKELLSNESLIDAFISSKPKIVPGESRYEVDLSESMQDITDIGTETLADIYAMQGNKDKAIKIYEQLILKYPEKNIYFAAQIKRLK